MDKENQIRQMIIAELANMDEDKFREIIRDELQYLIKTDKYVFSRKIVISDGRNIELALGVGTKIGTATDQKVAFLNATPVSRQSAITSPSAISGTYVQAEVASLKTATDAIITVLEQFGFIAPN